MLRVTTDMRIGLDIDGVCADFSRHFLEYLDLPRHDADDWDDPRFRKYFPTVQTDLFFWLTIPPIIQGDWLEFKPELYCTARGIDSGVSRAWLVNNGFPDAPVHTVPVHSSKVDVLKGKVDLFLDDSIRNFEELNAAGIPTLLVTRSHNVKHDARGMRVESLIHFQKQYLKDEKGILRKENSIV